MIRGAVIVSAATSEAVLWFSLRFWPLEDTTLIDAIFKGMADRMGMYRGYVNWGLA
jgi:hypothetical protein